MRMNAILCLYAINVGGGMMIHSDGAKFDGNWESNMKEGSHRAISNDVRSS